MNYLSDEAVETIRDALEAYISVSSTNLALSLGHKALALLEAEPPQAYASAEELARKLYILAKRLDFPEQAVALISADRLAVLEGAAERYCMKNCGCINCTEGNLAPCQEVFAILGKDEE